MPPAIARAKFRIAIEANNNWTITGHIAGVFADYAHTDETPCSFTRNRHDPDKVGFWTTLATKEQAIHILLSMIRADTCMFDSAFFGNKDILRDQLARLRKVRAAHSGVSDVDKYKITAKTYSHSSAIDDQDDQIMSLLILLYDAHELIHKHTDSLPTSNAKRRRFE